MAAWEYKVVPAPTRGLKGPGIKTGEARFAHALEALMNQMGAQGWEYQRADTLPSTERAGLTGSTTEWRNLLVFRRPVRATADDFEPELLPAPTLPEKSAMAPAAPAHMADATPAGQTPDNGVEDTGEMSQVTASLKTLATQRNDVKTEP